MGIDDTKTSTSTRATATTESKRHSAVDIWQSAMQRATVPRSLGSLPVRLPEPELEREATEIVDAPDAPRYIRLRTTHRKPPYSQRQLIKGECVCFCSALHHCDKLATLHPMPCEFCHGKNPQGPPPMAPIRRYYPTDMGWWSLRHQAKRLRQVAGLPDWDDATRLSCVAHARPGVVGHNYFYSDVPRPNVTLFRTAQHSPSLLAKAYAPLLGSTDSLTSVRYGAPSFADVNPATSGELQGLQGSAPENIHFSARVVGEETQYIDGRTGEVIPAPKS